MIHSQRKRKRIMAQRGLLGVSFQTRQDRLGRRKFCKWEKGTINDRTRNNNQSHLQNEMYRKGYSKRDFAPSLRCFQDTGANIPESRVSKTASTEYMGLKRIQLKKTLLKMAGKPTTEKE